jgi:hypothetical protein
LIDSPASSRASLRDSAFGRVNRGSTVPEGVAPIAPQDSSASVSRQQHMRHQANLAGFFRRRAGDLKREFGRKSTSLTFR